jgi:hypothetical protein
MPQSTDQALCDRGHYIAANAEPTPYFFERKPRSESEIEDTQFPLC